MSHPRSVPANANSDDIKAALEDMEQIDLVNVKFNSGITTFCHGGHRNPVTITIRKVNRLLYKEHADRFMESTVPLLKVVETGGIPLATSRKYFVVRRSLISGEDPQKPEYHFLVTGSQYVHVDRGIADFSRRRENSLAVDTACYNDTASYQVIFALSKLTDLQNFTQKISSSPFAVYPGSPKRMHITVEPNDVASWPVSATEKVTLHQFLVTCQYFP